jgi:hypothetical protein
VLLTTHYLEEAEALCGRIAMLKQGRVVALDRTSALLAGTASTMMRFKLDTALPPALSRSRAVTGRIVQVKAHDAKEVERCSRSARRRLPARRPGIGRADLENVFLEIMQGESKAAAAGRCRHDHRRDRTVSRAPARCSTRKCCVSGRSASRTVAAPVLTAVLYLLIFGHVLSGPGAGVRGRRLHQLPDPGLVMMSVLQNAFANSSSSLIQSKITGNLVFLLVAPLSHWAWYVAYCRGVDRARAGGGLGVLLVTLWFAPAARAEPGVDRRLRAARRRRCSARWGLIAGLWAEKFDQMARSRTSSSCR